MSSTTSRLLALPAELRSLIWELVLLPEVAEGDSSVRGYALALTTWDGHQEIRSGRKVQGTQPPITRVNGQLRGEALPIFYYANTFEVENHMSKMHGRANSWLTTQGESAAHIRSLYAGDNSWFRRTVHVRLGDCNGVIPSSAITIVCKQEGNRHNHSAASQLRWKRAVEALEVGIRGILEALEVKNISLQTWQLVLDCLGRFFGQYVE
ncbi:hypothetical protein LTR10_010749 [Elasticomyces elasticus]|nr:hypothetical protein LTR10_010749 [Elasticomyces elasticus]KAK4968355.1 hypothetical protein LTR42_009638 [Elasticomyces elasticus]